MVSSVLTVVGVGVAMFFVDPTLALVVMGLLPLLARGLGGVPPLRRSRLPTGPRADRPSTGHAPGGDRRCQGGSGLHPGGGAGDPLRAGQSELLRGQHRRRPGDLHLFPGHRLHKDPRHRPCAPGGRSAGCRRPDELRVIGGVLALPQLVLRATGPTLQRVQPVAGGARCPIQVVRASRRAARGGGIGEGGAAARIGRW